ncbi:MAG: hypothetical protein ACK559_05990 [bacterium]
MPWSINCPRPSSALFAPFLKSCLMMTTEARADIPAIDRDTALRLLKALDRVLKT